jgi:hypothetical protein
MKIHNLNVTNYGSLSFDSNKEQEENLQESQLVHIFCTYPIFPFVSPFDIVVAILSSVLDHC